MSNSTGITPSSHLRIQAERKGALEDLLAGEVVWQGGGAQNSVLGARVTDVEPRGRSPW